MRAVPVGALVVGCVCFAASASAQAQEPQAPQDASGGVAVGDSERVRLNVRFMAGYGVDWSHYDIGTEAQGRVGYAIVELSGKISERFTYRFELNPVQETQPLPACGDRNYFYPNEPQTFGPNVACDNNGRLRVDDYKFVGLDVLNQQGPIRQAYLSYRNGSGFFGATFGRFQMPIGFDWEDAGSLTAKDAPHIQRINAEANFGTMFSFNWRLATVNAGAVIGDGNRFHDYDYFYSLDGSLDTNSALTAMVSGDLHLAPPLDLRLALKEGKTGSRVEPLPNFYASKRHDRSVVASARYRVLPNVAVFGEYAWYTWGLVNTSADLINLPELSAIEKNGFYVGADASFPLTNETRLGATITREELDRDDSLIRYLWLQQLYSVYPGEKERSTVYRFYLDISRRVRVGAYFTQLENPFPQVSGITPVAGPRAYDSFGNNKWGVVGKFSLAPWK